MKAQRNTKAGWLREKATLRTRLAEAEQTLEAIRNGEVDALMMAGTEGERVFTLQGAETPYRFLIEEMNEGALLLGPEGTILYANARFAQLAGSPLEEVIGSFWNRFFIRPEHSRLQGLLSAAKEGAVREELHLQAHDGARRPVGVSLCSMKRERMEGFSVVVTDLTASKQAQTELQRMNAELEQRVRGRTAQWKHANQQLRHENEERKRIEQDLRASEERYRGLVEVSPDAIYISRDNRIIFVNRAGLRLFGASDPAQLLGKSPFQLFRPGTQSVREDQIHQAFEAGKLVPPIEAQILRLNGLVRDVEVALCPFPDQGGTSLQVLLHDITERKLLDREILSAVDEERQRLGRELHDGLCQVLTATKFKISLLERKLARKTSIEPAEARNVEQDVNRAIEQARAMAHGLNPVRLVAQGLVSALEELAANVQATSRLRCICQCSGPVPIADHSMAQHLYRIAQEAVHNALKHGRARNIRIQLKDLGDRISLAVLDDGVGFSRSSQRPAGMGLQNMKARAELIGGSLDIQPGQGGGTVVTCTFHHPPGQPENPLTNTDA